MKRFFTWLGSAGRATVALVGLTTLVAVADNYAVTLGSGTNFGSALISSVHYAKQLVCDFTAPATVCATVKAGNTLVAADVAVAVGDANVLAAVQAAIPAGTNLIGDVNLRQGGTALSATNPIFAAPIPTTSGGLTVETFQPTASTNSANIKGTPGQVYKIEVFNNSATVHYLRLYNTATTGTCNSATNLIWQGIIPASTSGAGGAYSWDLGIPFSSGIARCVTSGYDGTGNATASALITNIGYK